MINVLFNGKEGGDGGQQFKSVFSTSLLSQVNSYCCPARSTLFYMSRLHFMRVSKPRKANKKQQKLFPFVKMTIYAQFWTYSQGSVIVWHDQTFYQT